MTRIIRKSIAEETLAILEQGGYVIGETRVTVSAMQQAAVQATRLFTPADLEHLPGAPAQGIAARATTTDETTFAAARRLPGCLALNFASAKNPGGGFLGGAQAQEECLARASGLYPCLLQARSYYDANRACRTCLYTDHMIYSPGVPVFRDDDDRLLAAPVPVSILTAPAVNAGAVAAHERARIEPVMRQRLDYVLRVAQATGHRTLVLGAWGCGVFRNDPAALAGWFDEALQQWGGAFDQVVFAVPGRHGPNHRAFAARFGPQAGGGQPGLPLTQL